MPDCETCHDTGLVLLWDGQDAAHGVCEECLRGDRLRTVLIAIARGEVLVFTMPNVPRSADTIDFTVAPRPAREEKTG